MDRRAFLGGVSAALFVHTSPTLVAQCVTVAPGISGCRRGLKTHFTIVTQDCPERCWAASIAGIFRYQEHAIDQDVIAQAIFGTLACIPSGNTKVLDAVLSHGWADSDGNKFTAKITGLYDPLNGITEMDNSDLLTEMQNDNPVLVCNRTHAMVMVGMDYRKDALGHIVAVDQVHVADPYPGMGFHVLSAADMVPLQLGGNLTYVASVDVEDA